MLNFEKILVIVSVIIVTFGGHIIAIDEGSTCSFPDGRLGVCTKLSECESIDNGLQANTISNKNIVHCSFIRNTIVVCCPDRVPINIKPTRQYHNSDGGIAYLGNVNRRNRLNIPNAITRKVESLQNRPLFMSASSLSPARLVGLLVSEPTLSPNTINLSENTENINFLIPRPPTKTTADSLNNWNQGNNYFYLTNNNFASNNRNEKIREGESQSSEHNLDYQSLNKTTTTTQKSTIDYPWAPVQYRTTTPDSFLKWLQQTSTQRPTKYLSDTRRAVEECENYKSNLGPRIDFHIIDGEPTKPGEFPHMAGLGYREFDAEEYTWDCGGSLISNRFILTAAHCVDNPKRQPKLIRLGKTTVRNNDDGVEAVDVQIKKISIHPEYRSFAKYNDIALIEMTKPVKFSNEVGPACLYTNKDDLSDSTILVATGWGVNDVDKRTRSNILLKVNLTSNPLNNCNQSYFDYGFTRHYSAGLVSSQVCAYDKSFNKDACQGDSGGPLQLVDYSIHLSTIVGLTSFGIGCASEIPSVFSRVAFYLDWIESIVWP